MRCQTCGCNAPTKYVEFYQNIGALVMRFSSSVKGELCKRCINKHFTSCTLITAAVGWFGMISFCLTPFFILNNIVRFCGTIGMEYGEATPRRPALHPTESLTPEAVARLQPFHNELYARLQGGEDIDRITMDVGPRAGVSALQVEHFLEEKVAR